MVIRVTDLRNGQGDYKALDDRMLVLDFQAGHPEAFVEIHRRYSRLARHVCQRFLPNAHDADEALQETMIRVFQGLYRFNGRYALEPWIGRIATNVSLDAIRSRARRPLLDDESLEQFERQDPADGPEDAVERLIERDLVLSVLSGLPESHRTALVLRELEGRSHREIGEVMEMSPAQAKALIHRAKGSFRRNWLLAITEKGGFAGIAVLPLVWLLQGAHVARRVAERVAHAGQVAQAATPEVVSSVASSPAAVATGAGFGERVVAAGMTLLVAGGVTVGAATIVRDRGDRADRADRAEAPVVVPPSPEAPTLEEERVLQAAPRREREAERNKGIRVDPVVVEPTPVVAPTPGPTDAPSPEPTEAPSPEPTPEPTPEPILPAPPWTIGIQTWGPWSLACDCARSFRLVSSEVKGETSEQVFFVQEVAGEAVDAEGAPAWKLSAIYSGYAEGSQGRFSLFLDVETPEGESRYEGWGVLEAAEPTAGAVDHTYTGRYRLVSFRPADGVSEVPATVPSTGVLTAQVEWWADGTSLIGVVLILEER